MIGLVLRLPKFMVYYGFPPGFIFSYLSTGQKIAGKSLSDMTYIVSSGTLNPNSIKKNLLTYIDYGNRKSKNAP